MAINELLFNLVFVLPYYMISKVKFLRDIPILVRVRSEKHFFSREGQELRLTVCLCKFGQSLPVCVFSSVCTGRKFCQMGGESVPI